jgi:hypothetical protein
VCHIWPDLDRLRTLARHRTACDRDIGEKRRGCVSRCRDRRGKGQGLLFRKGEVVRKVPQAELADALVEEAWKLAEEEGE